MAKTKEARRKRSTKKKSSKGRRRRRVRAAVAAPRRRKRRAHKVRARRRKRAMVMEAPKRRRRRRKVRAVRTTRSVRAWRGNPAGHRKAAKKGHSRRRRRSRRTREVSETMVMAPRRRRRRRKVRASVVKSSRRRRSRRLRSSIMRAGRGGSMGAAELMLAVVSGGLGFVLADGVDRLLATYNPSGTEAPKDKFTSSGAGTLANTLNVAAKPSVVRIGAGVGMTAVPAFASMYVRNPYMRASLEGVTVGAGVSLFKTLWNNLLMPLLLPKDQSVPSLQKNVIARLYPAEVAAAINLKQGQTAVTGGAGALSGADVGPFALAGDSQYPDAAQAIRAQAGVHDQFPSLQNVWGTGGPGSDYLTAQQALARNAGMSGPAGHGNPGQPGLSWSPGPPSDTGPGPQASPHKDASCGCIGENNRFLGFVGDKQEQDQLFTIKG